MSKITEHVGMRIRNCRKRKGLTIEEFSKMINKSKATLSKYENGSIAIDIDTLLDIAEALEMELSHLINYRTNRVVSPMVIKNSYFDHSEFYMYFYDGRKKALIKSLLSLAPCVSQEHSADVVLYIGVSDFKTPEQCDSIYNGVIDTYDTTSHATLINQVNNSERIHLLLMNPMQKGVPAIGLLSGIGNPPLFSPVAIKTIVSKYILEENEAFNHVIAISKEELKQYKHYNMMIVGPSNYTTLNTK